MRIWLTLALCGALADAVLAGPPGKPRALRRVSNDAPAAARWVATRERPTATRGVERGPDLTVIARQAALDRAGFSPGLIDGAAGPKTELALRVFQQENSLESNGSFDDATLQALRVADYPPTMNYVVAADDLADIGDAPTDWNRRARLDRLRYESLTALLAERGHCTQATLGRLNPGLDLDSLGAGDAVTLPSVAGAAPLPAAALVEVNLADKTVAGLDRDGRTICLFPCSIARFVEKRPRGQTRVIKVALEPEYQFDPQWWPEVHTVHEKLTIPPGPRNPVGLAWIGLELPGYGIHGSPAPELIGKTGSHGCIRMTNWDALRLIKLVRVGTPVRFAGK